MAKYLNTVYGTDTYGVRIRDRIPFTVTTSDWTTAKITVGSPPSEYPLGTRIVLTRKTGFWPPLPYDNNKPPHQGMEFESNPQATDATGGFNPNEFMAYDPATVGEVCLMPKVEPFSEDYGKAYHPDWDENVVKVWILGRVSPPETLFDVVRPGVAMYYRLYVSEPLNVNVKPVGDGLGEHLLDEQQKALNAAHGGKVTCMWSPWEVAAEAYALAPKDLRGVPTVIDIIPTGLMTGGDVYGVIDENSVQYKFLSSLGLLSDIIQTDGSLIVSDMQYLHPHMVSPLLRGFGVSEDEMLNINAYYSAWDRVYESPYLKNFLYTVRDVSMRKGTSGAVTDYYDAAFKVPKVTLSRPENLLLTLFDTYPAEFSVSTEVGGKSLFDDRGSDHIRARFTECSVGAYNALWSRQYTGTPAYQNPSGQDGGYWSDIMTRDWSACGVQDSVMDDATDPTLAQVIPNPIPPGDPWELPQKDRNHYDQQVDFVWELGVEPGQTAGLGSERSESFYLDAQNTSVPVIGPKLGTSIFLEGKADSISIRFKILRRTLNGGPVHAVSLDDLWVSLDWMDEDGEFIQRQPVSISNVTSILNRLVSQPNTWVEVGTQVRPPVGAEYVAWTINVATPATNPKPVWLCIGAIMLSQFDTATYPAYRNPQSVVACVDYGKTEHNTDKIPSVIEIINTAKIDASLSTRLPVFISDRVVTTLTRAEYDEFEFDPVRKPLLTDPAYGSEYIDYEGSVYDKFGNKIRDKVVTYGHTQPLPEA